MDFDYQRNTQPINHNMAFAPFDSRVIIKASAVRQFASFDRLSIHDRHRWFSSLANLFPCHLMKHWMNQKLGLIRYPFVK
tara:strand:+ start:384 stop:623 length:240 start_codon:yes stop_codon:yes gene_type:complete